MLMQTNYSYSFLDQCRQQQDLLADAVIAWYMPHEKQALKSVLDQVVGNEFEPGDSLPEVFRALYEDVFHNVTIKQSETVWKGQQFFARYSSDILLLLGLLSLPYCYAAANGAEVLIRSKRIKEEPANRLTETAQFVFDVTAPNAFETSGRGLASILKVRLIHASIRYYVQRGGHWPDAYGKPVNQEDMAGTNLSFSLIPVRGMRKLGIQVSADESLDYIRYWNVIGKLLGLQDALLPDSNKAAYVLERNIRQRQFKSSAAGRGLTASLVGYFEQVMKGTPIDGWARSYVHYLLGDKVAGMLGLEVESARKSLFKPLSAVMKLQNLVAKKEDSYLAALKQFEQQKGITGVSSEIQLRD